MKLVILSFLLAGILSFSPSCISTSEVTIENTVTFPTVSGSDLQGELRTLPNDLTAERTILVVAFQRWQQSLCDEWYTPIAAYLKQNEHAEYFEIPTIAKMNPFTRWFIYQGMRGGIKDPEMRRRVVTLHIDKKPFKEALNIDSEKTVHVYILNKNGTILKQIDGKYSPEKWQDALQILDVKN